MAAIDQGGQYRNINGEKLFLRECDAICEPYNKSVYHGTTIYCVDKKFMINEREYVITKQVRYGDSYHYSLLYKGMDAGESYTKLAKIILDFEEQI